jgi:hypothetical protein
MEKWKWEYRQDGFHINKFNCNGKRAQKKLWHRGTAWKMSNDANDNNNNKWRRKKKGEEEEKEEEEEEKKKKKKKKENNNNNNNKNNQMTIVLYA